MLAFLSVCMDSCVYAYACVAIENHFIYLYLYFIYTLYFFDWNLHSLSIAKILIAVKKFTSQSCPETEKAFEYLIQRMRGKTSELGISLFSHCESLTIKIERK